MGVYEGKGQLTKALKELNSRWLETKGSWEDANSRQFEQGFLQTLEQDLKNTVGAMDHMAILIQQAKRDCSESR